MQNACFQENVYILLQNLWKTYSNILTTMFQKYYMSNIYHAP